MDRLLPVIVRVLGLRMAEVLRIEGGGVLRQGHWNTRCTREPFSTRPIRGIDFVGKNGRTAPASKIPKKLCRTCCSSISSGLQSTQRRTLSIFIRNRALLEENAQLREELFGRTETGGMSGKSRAFQDLLELARTVALRMPACC